MMRRPRTSRSELEVALLGFLARRLGGPLVAGGIAARRDQLSALPVPPGKVVLLGDSITDQGEWHELLPSIDVINRGVGGENTRQVLARVDTVINAPAAVSLLVGTNDLTAGTPPGVVGEAIGKILRRIEQLAPGSPVILNAVFPRAPRFAREIRMTNRALRSFARTMPSVVFLDLWSELADDDSALRPELTYDGLHLNGAGYQLWAERLGYELRRLTLE